MTTSTTSSRDSADLQPAQNSIETKAKPLSMQEAGVTGMIGSPYCTTARLSPLFELREVLLASVCEYGGNLCLLHFALILVH